MKKRKEEDRERRIKSKEDHESIYEILEHVPLDLILDILLRLPAKSVSRFRCVSKLWSSITTRPYFINSFKTHQSSSTRLCLLVSFETRDKRYFISLPQHEHQVTSYSHVDSFDQTNHPESDNYVPYSESIHGLMCYVEFDKIVVWNPTMRQEVTLPKPKPRVENISSCLGYDPVEKKYKVLCFLNHKDQDPLVFTLGAQESWRVIHNSPKHGPIITRMATCIDGHMYYQAWLRMNGTVLKDEKILMSFDVRYEKFKTIKTPDDHKLGNFILNYMGKVAWVCVCTHHSCITFWVLEDEEKQEWSLRNFHLPFPIYPERDSNWGVILDFKGVTHDTGEFIYVAASFEAIKVLYYDPKTNRTRRVIYKGFGDKEFKERNGIEYITSSCIHYYPNHIESLMSLENVPRLVRDISPMDS